MIKKELRIVNVEDLKPYDGNPRRNNQSAKIVAKSIQTYGYINPIVVTDELVVLAGHTRLKALKLLGYTQIDVLVVHGLTKEQIDGFVRYTIDGDTLVEYQDPTPLTQGYFGFRTALLNE